VIRDGQTRPTYLFTPSYKLRVLAFDLTHDT
jgi:hypothetical protein